MASRRQPSPPERFGYIPEGELGAKGAVSGRLGRVRDRALDAAMRMLDGVSADAALEQIFRKARDLGPAERAEVSELVYGLARSLRRIDHRLVRASKAAGRKLEMVDASVKTRLRLLALEAEMGASFEELQKRDPYAVKRIPGLFERITSGRVPAPKTKTVAEAIGLEWSLPDWLVSRLVASFGEVRTEEIAKALFGRASVTLRVDTSRVGRDELLERIRQQHGIEGAPTRISPLGIILPSHVRVRSWPEFEEGLIDLQDEGSQLVALAVGAKPGETVVDACAGAGGKTLTLSSMMKNSGRVLSFDPDAQKLQELKKRARRAALTNIETHAVDFGRFPPALAGRADRVLVDAPCTGSGRLRRQPDARWRFGEAEVVAFPALQARLLLRAIDAVRPGGLIVYATCSLLAEENEGVVERVCETDPRVRPVSLESTLGGLLEGQPVQSSLRLGPGPAQEDPDGFFLTLLERIDT